MEIRGLLDFACNSMLRRRWTPELLRAAADYLENPPLRDLDKEKGAEAPSSPPLTNHFSRDPELVQDDEGGMLYETKD
jgi:hypothetical protein